MSTWVRRAERGYSFIELLIVTTILLILAAGIQPLARVTIQRQKESELRHNLRDIREAIDSYYDLVATGRVPSTELKPGNEGYPPDLETLVEGVPLAGDATGRRVKLLRRIPVDPMTGDTDWALRSYQDKPDSTRWGGQNVFDVRSTSGGKALDGTKYSDW
ncbi:MAG: type II secretion system protein [Acidobacteria bacterium]|nr:type II secretion system protein [Acidobacteriota bacterium]